MILSRFALKNFNMRLLAILGFLIVLTSCGVKVPFTPQHWFQVVTVKKNQLSSLQELNAFLKNLDQKEKFAFVSN